MGLWCGHVLRMIVGDSEFGIEVEWLVLAYYGTKSCNEVEFVFLMTAFFRRRSDRHHGLGSSYYSKPQLCNGILRH